MASEHWQEILLALGVVIPVLSFAFLVFFGSSLGKPRSGWIATLAIGASTVLSTIVMVNWLGLSADQRAVLTENAYRFYWADLGDMPLTLGVKMDSLTVIMFFMVGFVSTWIHVFSIGYMAGHSDEIDGQSKYHRFFAYLSLFCFSMLGLVISSSLLFLFIFWELVGLCSYLLIGFYFHKKSASDAGLKAFVVNRVGDFGFLIGLMMVVFYLGEVDLEKAAAAFGDQYYHGGELFAGKFWGIALATWMGMCLFCGAIGKSAQFPLHVWLPDAMEGPTPVSALIHAATMVAAGVYLVARIFRLLTPEAQMFIAVIGCITLTMTALIAIVQTDIKRVLAYSTLSQLGYMVFGMGVGAWIAALFHLMTHAFFKALMFLCSGQVIEGCHHEQDIRNMGGLRKKMPATCWTFFVGVIAIAGVGIPGTAIGIGGFFSKDEILAVAYHRSYGWNEAPEHHAAATLPGGGVIRLASDEAGHGDEVHAGEAYHSGHGAAVTPARKFGQLKALPKWLFWLPIIIAYITPFYMMRCWWLTFMGKPRNKHVYEHAHETPMMWVPLVVLAVGTFFASYFLFRPLLADAAPAATDAVFMVGFDGHAADAAHAHGEMVSHSAHQALIGMVGFAFVIGFALAILIYYKGLAVGQWISKLPLVNVVYAALMQKLFFDHVYDFFLVGGTKLIAFISRLFDTYVVDLIFNLAASITARFAFFSGDVLDNRGVDGMVNGIGDMTQGLGDVVRQPQTGRLRNYALFAAGGAVIVLLIVLAFSANSTG